MTSPASGDLRLAKWRLAIDVPVQTDRLEFRIQALERIPATQGKPAQIVPIRFFPANKLPTEDKLLLGFDAHAVSEIWGRKMPVGRIVHGDEQAAVRVNTSSLAARVQKVIEKATTLVSHHTSPPDLVLNRHCGECEFQLRCRQMANSFNTSSSRSRLRLRRRLGVFPNLSRSTVSRLPALKADCVMTSGR